MAAVVRQQSALVIELAIWVHDGTTRRCRRHPARLRLEAATVEGPLVAGYEILSGRVAATEGRWDGMIPIPLAIRAATLRWNEGCGGPLAPVTLAAGAATLEITGPATLEETMP
ncbi:MAG TPA: hypothetical protein VF945_01455 [Polyangia bacterium]